MPNFDTNPSSAVGVPLPELVYVLLPLRFGPDFAQLALYNQLFHYWLQFWTEVLRGNGTSNKIDPKDFLGFDYASLLLAKNQQIAGVTLHRLINFQQEPAAFHPYLDSEFRAYSLAHPSRLAMTVEYVTVDPKWRKQATGLSLSQTLLRIAARLQQSFEADVSFIKARQDVKVSESVLRLGGRTLRADIEMHNTPVSFQVIPKDAWIPHPDPEIESLSHRLWRERHDYRFQTTRRRIENESLPKMPESALNAIFDPNP